MAQILIVEDDKYIRQMLVAFLQMHYEVIVAGDGNAGLEAAQREQPHLVILDVGLPDFDGFDVCRKLRQEGFVAPILFLTSHGEELDKLKGFGVGGDDYIVKPVSLPELQARIHAALRRSQTSRASYEARSAWQNVEVDFMTHEVQVDGEEVQLSPKEMELLAYLVRNKGRLISRDELLSKVWHYDSGVSSRTVDTHILNLRRKLGDGEAGERSFHTVRGKGYKFSG